MPKYPVLSFCYQIELYLPGNALFIRLSRNFFMSLQISDGLVAAAFASLPQPGQSILILHCVLELTDGEIGAVVGMSRSAVQRHRTKTLETMRTRLTGGIAE